MMRDPELALETHAREELGINPERARLAAAGRRGVVRRLRPRRPAPLLPVAVHARARRPSLASVVIGGGGRRWRVGAVLGVLHRPLPVALGPAPAGAWPRWPPASPTASAGRWAALGRLSAGRPSAPVGRDVDHVGPVDVVDGEAERAVEGDGGRVVARRRRACRSATPAPASQSSPATVRARPSPRLVEVGVDRDDVDLAQQGRRRRGGPWSSTSRPDGRPPRAQQEAGRGRTRARPRARPGRPGPSRPVRGGRRRPGC